MTTAMCSLDDTYSKKIANKLVAENIKNGASIKIPLPLNTSRHYLTTEELYMIMDSLFHLD
jgi:hypothetical protein